MSLNVPTIIASEKFLAASGPVSQTLYTPARRGLFRASLYLDVSSAASAGSMACSVSWVDSSATRTVFSSLAPSAGQYAVLSVTFICEAGSPIIVGAAGSPSQPLPFDFYATIESLQE